MKDVIMAIDPGTQISGYALFKRTDTGPFQLKQYGLIKVPRGKTFQVRCIEMQFKIRPIFTKHEVTTVVMEYPQFQAGMRGMSAARKGNTLTLAFLCGGITTNWNLFMLGHFKRTKQELPFVYLTTPSEWKGQLPKAACAKRCFRKYGTVSNYKESDFNWSDAVMIGDWWICEDQEMESKPAEEVIRVDL